MIPGWQIEAYERLRTEVLRLAVKDLERALRKSDRLGVVCDEQKNMERWFLSSWGQLLSGDKGEYIIERCRNSYKASVSNKRKRRIPNDVQQRIYEDYKSGVRHKTITQQYGINSTTLYNIVRRWQK